GGDLIPDPPSYGLSTANSGVSGVGLAVGSKGIRIRGFGGNWRHSNTTAVGSTTLRALTAGMTMVQFAAPATGQGIDWGFGGLEGIYFDGNALTAAIGLEILSWRFGRFREIGGNIFSTAAIHMGVQSSTLWTSGATRSPQLNE